MMVQKKNTILTNKTRSDGFTKAILIIDAGIQSFPYFELYENEFGTRGT